MRNKRNNGGILREARNEFEAELTSDTLLCFLLTDSGMTTYEISPTIYSPVRKDLEWSLTCNKGPHFATPLPGWDRNASSTDVMGYQDRTRYDGRPHYIIHNPGKGISRSGTFADVGARLPPAHILVHFLPPPASLLQPQGQDQFGMAEVIKRSTLCLS